MTVPSVEALNDEVAEAVRRTISAFVDRCESLNLNKTSMAALLGISKQSLAQYRDKTVPCPGVVLRAKLVTPLLEVAEQNGTLPAPTRRLQDHIVRAILQ